MFRYFFNRPLQHLLLLLLLAGCSDIPRDNLLDPKNPQGYSDSVILIEAFVNTSAAIPGGYSEMAEAGLDEVQRFYGDKVIIVEYHRDIKGYDDPFNTSTTNIRFTQLHEAYTTGQEIPRAVPDIFINGSERRVSGASSAATVAEQVRQKTAEISEGKNYLSIDIEAELLHSAEIQVTCRIASLGNKAAENKKLRLIYLTKGANNSGGRTVQDLVMVEKMPDISKGGIVKVTFDSYLFTEKPDKIVVAVTSGDGLHIIQAAAKEL